MSKVNPVQTVISLGLGAGGAKITPWVSSKVVHFEAYKALERNAMTAAKWTKNGMSKVAGRNLMHGNRLNSLTKKHTQSFVSESTVGMSTYLGQKAGVQVYDYTSREVSKAIDDMQGLYNQFHNRLNNYYKGHGRWGITLYPLVEMWREVIYD